MTAVNEYAKLAHKGGFSWQHDKVARPRDPIGPFVEMSWNT